MLTAKDLLELQQIDLAIIRDRKAIEEIPETAQIQEVRAKQKELARRVTKIVGLLKDQRIAAEDNHGRRATLSRYVQEVNADNASSTDFRRIQNNNAELDRLAKRLEKLDFNQNQVAAETKKLEAALDQAKGIKERLDAREAALLESFKQTAHDLREHLQRLGDRREALLESLPEDVVARYTESCKSHGRIGVAELRGATCSGCGVELQQSQIDGLRCGPAVSVCPVCGRMLVVRTTGE